MSEAPKPVDADKDRRDRVIWIAIVILGVMVAAVALTFGSRVMGGRLEAAKQLDGARALLKETQPVFADLDDAVRANPNTTAATKAQRITGRLAPVRVRLANAIAELDAGMPHLTDAEQRHARLVQTASEARIEILDASLPILSAMKGATAATSSAEKPLAEYLAARQKADDADEALRSL